MSVRAVPAVLSMVLTALPVSCVERGGEGGEGGEAGEAMDFPGYEMREMSAVDPGCPEDTTECTHYVARFPEFLGEGVAVPLQEAVFGLLTGSGSELRSSTDLRRVMDSFVQEYLEFKSDFPESPQIWVREASVGVVLHRAGVLCLKLEAYEYTGGAHGLQTRFYSNHDAETGAALRLADLFAPGFQSPLTELVEVAFRNVRGLSPEEDLQEAGFFLTEGRFPLSETFGMEPEALVFYYNPYEIAPYALGSTEVKIPYRALANLAAPGGPLVHLARE